MSNRSAYLFLFLFVFGFSTFTPAQEINFGQFGNYSVTFNKFNNLSFGSILTGSGLKQIQLSDPEKATIQVSGAKNLDIIVDITADPELLLNGNTSFSGDPQKSIPYTLEAAYANKGDNIISDAELFNVSSNSASARFQIVERTSGPPGPPPTPPHEGFTPPQGSAYIYIYGSINVGSVDAGSYTGNITITVTYN